MKREFITVNGISFNVRINAGLTAEAFIAKNVTTPLPGVGAMQRENVLREMHKLIVSESGQVQAGDPPELEAVPAEIAEVEEARPDGEKAKRPAKK